MSSPVLKIGSIFGANKPSKPQSQPNQADKSIFGSQSSKFEASSRKISPQNQRSQGMSNIASLSGKLDYLQVFAIFALLKLNCIKS